MRLAKILGNSGRFGLTWCALAAALVLGAIAAFAGDAPRASEPDATIVPPARTAALAPIHERFAADTDETPDFQRHVSPLLGRMGCNGRACHGSFQGQGGFRLSLFGYDHKADLASLFEKDTDRVNRNKPEESLILRKPTLQEDHEGGERFKADSWAYRVLRKWIASGANGPADNAPRFEKLVVEPSEINFAKNGKTVALRAIAHWSDGAQEDVTPLCRFRTNDESVATVDEDGRVTSVSPGNTHVVAFYDNGVTPVQILRPVSELAGANYPGVPTPTKIDELVVAKLRKLGIVPSELSTDAEFLRRVTLDITGTLPTPAEVEAFLADRSAGKRQKKIDELLESPGYAMWWTTKLCDITGNNPRRSAEQQLAEQQSRQWYDWIHRRVKENVPYDKIVEGIALAVSRAPGQSYEDYCKEMSSYFRPEKPADFSQRETMPYFWSRIREGAQAKEKAMSFSYAFLGVRLQCAECHKHPFDQWTKEDFDQFTAFFEPVVYGNTPQTRPQYQQMMSAIVGDLKGGMAQRKLTDAVKNGQTIPWREVFVANSGRPNNPARGKNAKNNKNRRNMPARRVVTPKILGEDETVDVTRGEDPRAALMGWMRERDNPYFARSFVNRVWAAYFNVGIIEPPDDLNLANPPSNEPLLDYLTHGFIDSGYDMKWLHREIANSRTYQLSWKVNETNRLDERNFSHAVLRRLPAEVAYDAVTLATASDAELVAFREDVSRRAIGPSSSGPRRGPSNFALQAFGRPERLTNCDCERTSEPSLLQALFLRNDQDVLRMIDRPEGWIKQVSAELGQDSRPERRDVADANGKGDKQSNSAQEREDEIRRLRRQIAMLDVRAERLKKNGEDEQAQRVRRRIERLTREARELAGGSRVKAVAAKEEESKRKKTGDEKASSENGAKAGTRKDAAKQPAAEPDVGAMIRAAYLRTLSRPPTAEEEQRIRRHLGANGKVTGLRDAIWALVNSKEFIVNH
ncbi:MAG: hypothetical protein DCC68_16555 [Planctomycetota bacterium]|nr:MAG: hypothetical protein DCC68_16555 [Planctomycetota bacterium]